MNEEIESLSTLNDITTGGGVNVNVIKILTILNKKIEKIILTDEENTLISEVTSIFNIMVTEIEEEKIK